MTKKLPYTHEVCSGQVRFLDSSDILFHFSLVLFTLILSHIIATRVGLDLSCMTCILKYSLTSAIKWLATKKDLGPFKIDRAVVDSNRSVNLPFDIRKILSLYLSSEEKRYQRSSNVSAFRSATCHRSSAGGLTCIRRGDLFVSWSGCREDQTPKAFWWTILFKL